MARYLIERNFADQLEVTKDAADEVRRINDEEGVKWLFSFLSADKRKTYCLYEAPNAEAIRIAARRANLPADVIIEVGGELRPEMFPCSPAPAMPGSGRAPDLPLTPDDLFRRHPLLGALEADDKRELLRRAQTRNIRAGQTLFRKDDAGDGLYGVMSGRIVITVESATGKELILNTFGPGTF